MTLPTGTITFLFTDVEDSVRLWEKDADSMRQALARHDTLAAETIAVHDGLLIKSRGEGDSLFVVFARAADALACACRLQIALTDEMWPTPDPLRVRMALHSGEADLREMDYYGAAVNRCARLRAITQGGQVLLSRAVRELCQDALLEEVALLDLGERRLRDMAEPEYVYQLSHPQLPIAFSPIPPDATRPTHLALADFLNPERDLRDLAEVKRLLSQARWKPRPSLLPNALKEAHKAGLEKAKRVLSERPADAEQTPAPPEDPLIAVLQSSVPGGVPSRLALIQALLKQGGLRLKDAKKLVEDFYARKAAEDAARRELDR